MKANRCLGTVSPTKEDAATEVGALLRQVALAASQLARVGTPAQLVEARQLLSEVRRKLYETLARDERSE